MADELSNEQIDEIVNLLKGDKKIQAIKVYRQATGKGLKEANDFIQAVALRLKEQEPQPSADRAAPRSGCASAVLLVVGFSTAALGWIVLRVL